MADEKKAGSENTTKKIKAAKSDLVGHLAEPVPLKNQVKMDVDLDHSFTDHLVMAGLTDKLDMTELDKFTTLSNNRELQYSQLDIMFADATVSTVARTYAEDVCEPNDNGHIVWAESDNPKISMFVNYLLNVSNVDKNIYNWAYNLVKYGEIYLKMMRESDFEDKLFKSSNRNKVQHSVLNEELDRLKQEGKLDENIYLNLRRATDKYAYRLELIPDPSTCFELTKHDETVGFIEVPNAKLTSTDQDIFSSSTALGGMGTVGTVGQYNYRMKSSDIIVHQSDEMVHAYLADGMSRFPETVDVFIPDDEKANTPEASGTTESYTIRRGKSLFADAYKIWREKSLLEAAVLLSRLTKSKVIHKVGVEVANSSRERSTQILRDVKAMFEQKNAYNANVSMDEYTNPGPTENFVYHVTRDGKGAITVDTIGGDYDPKSLSDLDDWNTKFYSSFGIPKQYFGWTEDGAGFNGGSSLTILSSIYGKGVKRVQNALIQMLNTAVDLWLYDNGCISYLNNYVIKMRAPLTEEENKYRENLANRINAISSYNSLFNDVETKSTRLELLKELVSTLNYGDKILAILDREIKDVKAKEEADRIAEEEAKKAEAEANALEAQNGESAETSSTTPSETTSPDNLELDLDLESGPETTETTGGEDNLNLDLASLPAAPDTPQESFTNNGGSLSLTEDTEFLDESTDLPNPDELGDIDFSKNK